MMLAMGLQESGHADDKKTAIFHLAATDFFSNTVSIIPLLRSKTLYPHTLLPGKNVPPMSAE
jgi:hypothetical protein